MGMRFRKSKNIGPVRFTMSKSGISSSVGFKGFRLTKTADGRYRTTASIPGTGISYVKDISSPSNHELQQLSPMPQEPRVRGKAAAYFFIVVGCGSLLSSLSMLFSPGSEYQIDNWWKPLIPAAIFFCIAVLLFSKRKSDLEAYSQWQEDLAIWKQEQEELDQITHEREIERLEKQLQLEKIELEKIKTKAAAEFGEK